MEPYKIMYDEAAELDVVQASVDAAKPKPIRSRHDPVGQIPSDLVDRVLKMIPAKDVDGFKAAFAARVGWSSVTAMDRAHRRAMRFAREGVKQGKRIPSHIAKHIAETDLLSQALVRRVG